MFMFPCGITKIIQVLQDFLIITQNPLYNMPGL